MSTFAILASGPSMSQAVAGAVRGRCRAIAVSDSYRLAPWADALVAQDWAWWKVHQEAKFFRGRKFCGPAVRGESPHPVEQLEPDGMIVSSTNSGLLACLVAVKFFGASRILLLGLDMHGSHFFGPHPSPLGNTSEQRFEALKGQFARWKPKGVEVLNCTPGSGLQCFKFADLEVALARMAEPEICAA
jgi:hypothetical protein